MARSKRRTRQNQIRFDLELTNEEILAQLEPMWFGPGAEPGQGRTR